MKKISTYILALIASCSFLNTVHAGDGNEVESTSGFFSAKSPATKKIALGGPLSGFINPIVSSEEMRFIRNLKILDDASKDPENINDELKNKYRNVLIECQEFARRHPELSVTLQNYDFSFLK